MEEIKIKSGTLVFEQKEGRVFSDFAKDKIGEIYFPNKSETKEHTPGGVIAAQNSNADQATLTIYIVKNSPDDKFLEGNYQHFTNEDTRLSFIFFKGKLSFIQDVKTIVYEISDGTPERPKTISKNGETLSVWQIKCTAVKQA